MFPSFVAPRFSPPITDIRRTPLPHIFAWPHPATAPAARNAPAPVPASALWEFRRRGSVPVEPHAAGERRGGLQVVGMRRDRRAAVSAAAERTAGDGACRMMSTAGTMAHVITCSAHALAPKGPKSSCGLRHFEVADVVFGPATTLEIWQLLRLPGITCFWTITCFGVHS